MLPAKVRSRCFRPGVSRTGWCWVSSKWKRQGAVVTLDAMGRQRAIAEQIVAQGGDYVLGLKGYQWTLHEDVALLFDEDQGAWPGIR